MSELKSQATGIAVWGVGLHARKTVLPAIAACNSLKLVGIGTRNAEIRTQQAESYQCLAWSSLDDLLECPDVEVVYLATPIGLHYGEGLQVLGAGRHLWCEKSFTSSLTEADEIFDVANAGDRSLCVVCSPLYHDQFRKIGDLIRQGSIGEVQSVTGVFEFPHLSDDNIRYDPEIGGSALLDLGFYPVIVPYELCGGEIISVSAKLEYQSGYHIDTSGEAIFTMGSEMELRAYWGYGPDYRNEMIINGELGSLHVSPAFSKPAGQDLSIDVHVGEQRTRVPVTSENQFANMLQSYSKAMRDDNERRHQRKWALHTQNLLDRVKSSAV